MPLCLMQRISRAFSVESIKDGTSSSSESSIDGSDSRILSDKFLRSHKQQTAVALSIKFLEEDANSTLPILPKSGAASDSSNSHQQPTTNEDFVNNQLKTSKHKGDVELATSKEANKGYSVSDTIHDTDGGWAWMVLAAGFLQFVVSSGIFYSWGVFFVPVLETFEGSRARTAWVFSTNAAVHQLAGPLGGYLIPRLGARLTVMLSGVLAASGCMMSAFAPSLEFMYFSHGVVNAIGTSLNFSGWVVGISHFFVKKRGLALGFAMSGSGWGVLALGPALAKFVPAIGWRKAMMMCAGLSLNFIVFGAFIYYNKIAKADSSKQKVLLSVKSGTSGGNASANIKSEFQREGINLTKDDCKYKQKAMFNEAELVMKSDNTTEQDKKKKIQWVGVQISCVLSIMATSTVYTLLKDWITWIGLDEIISYSLMAAGVGDIVGRIFAGILSWVISRHNVSVLALFGGTHVLLAVSLTMASLGTTPVVVLCSVVGIGFAGGLQCVFTAIAPMGNNSAKELGTLLLAGGVGALIGPPLGGFLVDYTGSYSITLIVCAAAPVTGAVTCIVCYFLSQRFTK